MEPHSAQNEIVKLFAYDGQTIWQDRGLPLYEVGNFLGGGAAGTVYECENMRTRDHFALKILNPVGYKLLSPMNLKRCTVVSKGRGVSDAMERSQSPLGLEHIWWLINGPTKQYICAYYSEKMNSLKEFSLTQCMQLWGPDPVTVNDMESGSHDGTVEVFQCQNGPRIVVPAVPPKYADFVRKRRRIFREIQNMRKITDHKNVIRLENVLELTQESKCTIFLVMELANGGELFDRIKLDCGAREETAKLYFQQLLEGVCHCHQQGVCHRDLKPENLLLQDGGESSTTLLKIADFGFSARFAMGTSFRAEPVVGESPLRILQSVVGSPYYVAPEVLQARGYDGPKADIWSLGVILYAMLAGNLPFEQELSTCKRFRLFCKWVRDNIPMKASRYWEDPALQYPQWLFPSKFSLDAKSLIVSMLHPDPEMRITIAEAMAHPLLAASSLCPQKSALSPFDSMRDLDKEMPPQSPSSCPAQADSDDFQRLKNVAATTESIEVCDDDFDEVGCMEEESEAEQEQFVMEEDVEVTTPPKNHASHSGNKVVVIPTTPSVQSVSRGALPPLPPATLSARQSSDRIDDLLLSSGEAGADIDISVDYESRPHRAASMPTMPDPRPPHFSDLVKRSSRFITAVPAGDVLDKVEGLLEHHRQQRTATPIGIIGRVSLHWETYRLEVWGADVNGPSLCALQLYRLPSGTAVCSLGTSPLRHSHEVGSCVTHDSRSGAPGPIQFPLLEGEVIPSSSSPTPSHINPRYGGLPQFRASPDTAEEPMLFLVEFLRGQLDIFAFKRFYQWVRLRLSELVKRDYSFKLFDQAASPMVESSLFRMYQER